MKKWIFFSAALMLYSSSLAQNKPDTGVVHFPFNKHHLTPGGKAVLDEFIQTYHQSPGASAIRLQGHTDARGTNSYNDELSEKRVRTVRDYLVGHGIASASIQESIGLGENHPRYANDTEENMQWNRRVEIIWQKPLPVVQEEKTEEPIVEDPVSLTEKIDSVKEGETLRLRNINFYGGRHTFLPQSLSALNELLEVMRTHPSLEIEIQGHICCFTTGEDGMDYDSNDRRLSLNRARAVYDYLVRNGIDKSRMSYKGYAGTKLLVYPEITEADRTMNRRVEIRILKK